MTDDRDGLAWDLQSIGKILYETYHYTSSTFPRADGIGPGWGATTARYQPRKLSVPVSCQLYPFKDPAAGIEDGLYGCICRDAEWENRSAVTR